MLTDLRSLHSTHSSLREKIVEHQFIGDVQKYLWQQRIFDVEILKSEFDAGGYDLVLAVGSLTRHIQLKTALFDGSKDDVSINLNLATKPSGCVVWIDVDLGLNIKGFRWFGDTPGNPLPDIFDLRVTKHTKGTGDGVKKERPNHRKVGKTKFGPSLSLSELMDRLLGL